MSFSTELEVLNSLHLAILVQLEVAVLALGCLYRSKGGWLVGQHRAVRLQLLPFTILKTTLEKINIPCSAPRFLGIGEVHLAPQKDKARCFQRATAACFWE